MDQDALSEYTFGEFSIITYKGGQVLYKNREFISSNFGEDNAVYYSAAANMSGKCYISGMGLGTLPSILSMKENITEIVVCEKEPLLYDFHINKLPEKVTLIQSDALFYLPTENYDYGFHDIWSGEQNDSEERYLLTKLWQIIDKQTTFWRFKNNPIWP